MCNIDICEVDVLKFVKDDGVGWDSGNWEAPALTAIAMLG